ncbi:hypothetical protein BGX38DRAFT_1271782 [Terfezia claveryi]|nr:hypothetical protein BGX38DRAFT_1271782 [Terfezia claveryi]
MLPNAPFKTLWYLTPLRSATPSYYTSSRFTMVDEQQQKKQKKQKKQNTKHLRLQSVKEIIFMDGERGGIEEVVVVNKIAYEERSILVVEAKRSSSGQALKQCLLALKDMGSNNGHGKVYGFVTTGKGWQMVE